MAHEEEVVTGGSGKRCGGSGTAIAAALLALLSPARAEFEKWTSKDGKIAELELVRIEKVEGEEMAVFRTRSGKAVSMRLTDLAQSEWKRAREAFAAPAADLKVTFKAASAKPPVPQKGRDPLPASMEFLFAVRCDTYAGFKPDSLEVAPFEIGGKRLSGKGWRAAGGGGRNAGLFVRYSGDFDASKFSGCKLDANIVALIGTTKSTAQAAIKIPKKQGDSTKAKVGPFTAVLERTSQRIRLEHDYESGARVIGRHLERDGKDIGKEIQLADDDQPVKVVIEYWEELRESPVKLEATVP